MPDPVIKKFGKNEWIFREGDPGEEMYIIHAGKVRLLKQVQSRIETISTLERGDFFGEMAIIDKQPRQLTAIAVDENTELICFDLERFQAMLQANVEIALKIIRIYAKRLNETNAKLEKLLIDKQELDLGIQDILSNVRHKAEGDDSERQLFGWLQLAGSEERFALKRPEVLIGRRDMVSKFTPDVDLTDLDQQRTISRRHARIICLDDGVYVSEETGVVNGTFVKEQQIEKNRLVRVDNRDHVRFGKVDFIILVDPS